MNKKSNVYKIIRVIIVIIVLTSVFYNINRGKNLSDYLYQFENNENNENYELFLLEDKHGMTSYYYSYDKETFEKFIDLIVKHEPKKRFQKVQLVKPSYTAYLMIYGNNNEFESYVNLDFDDTNLKISSSNEKYDNTYTLNCNLDEDFFSTFIKNNNMEKIEIWRD